MAETALDAELLELRRSVVSAFSQAALTLLWVWYSSEV